MTSRRRKHLKKITKELVLDLKATPSLPTSQRGCQAARCHNWKEIIQSFTSESHESLWKRTKNGCWKELNCLISIPTLNIYLKVKLKPLQKLKTGCVNTMLGIYNAPQGRASPTKVPENSPGTWMKDLRSFQTPRLSQASESTQSPQGKTCDDWVYRSSAWPCSQGGHRSTLHSSSPTKDIRHMAHPHHTMASTCHILGPTCPPDARKLSPW